MANNERCPWSGDAVSADSLTTYQGHTVGFCNPGCRDKFERATNSFEKSLAEAGKYGPFQDAQVRAARYNRVLNERLFGAIEGVDDEVYYRDLGAFFGSMHTTLNHIMVWDILWLQRFARHDERFTALAPIAALSAPTAHDQILHPERAALAQARVMIDKAIECFVLQLREDDHATVLSYAVASGEVMHKAFAGVLQHMFNHQTHHRGQISTLLWQSGVDLGVTDLLAILPDLSGEPG